MRRKHLSDHNCITVDFGIQMIKGNFRKGKWEEVKYCAVDDKSLREFVKGMEESLNQKSINNIIEMDNLKEQIAKDKLERVYKRKMLKDGEIPIQEQPWVTDRIRNGIKERRKLNRKKRDARNEDERKRLEEEYLMKKREVQILVKEEITNYEQKETREIRKNRNKVWENIDRLTNKNTVKKGAIYLHSEQGLKLNKEEAKLELVNFWTGIYGKHDNDIHMVWNTEKRQEYVSELQQIDDNIRTDVFNIPEVLREHYDQVMYIRRGIKL